MTPYEQRMGRKYDGPLFPFGAQIEYKPSSKKGLQQLPKVGWKTLPGIFIGYSLKSGGEWDGDLLVADKRDLSVATTPSIVPVRRLKADEVFAVKNDGEWIFPLTNAGSG